MAKMKLNDGNETEWSEKSEIEIRHYLSYVFY